MTAPDVRKPTLNTGLLIVAYAALLIFLLWRLAETIARGGNPWQQGDWLINYGAGFVRRGLSGDLLFRASDLTGADPLILLGVAQALMLAALVIGIARAALAAGIPDRLLVLLLSPAFLPFWGYDDLGAMRKEMLALLAFLPLLAPGTARWRAVAALLVFALAVAVHEANAFLAPFLAAALWLAQPKDHPRRLYLAATAAIALAVMIVALGYPTVSDPDRVCREIVAHGLREGLCGGAIRWLGFDLDRVLAEGRARIEAYGFPVTAFVSYALAMLPVAAALWQAPRRGALIAAALASGLVLAPLWVVALDWGRWIFLHAAGLTLVTLTALHHHPVPWLRQPLDRRAFVFLLAASAMWSMSFYTGETAPGLLLRLAGIGPAAPEP